MADGFLNQFLAKGTAALRAAFTPSPPTVITGTPDQAYTWYETDTKRLKAYGSAWEEPNPGLSNVISPAQITANQDDYNPTGLAGSGVLRLNSDASRNITGLQGGVDGRVIAIENVGSNPIVLKNNVTSTAANRFLMDADATLAANTAALLRYDGTSSRWRLLAIAKVSGSTVTTTMGITIDGGGSVITTGIKGDLEVPVACTITVATMLADQSGSAVVDIWKDTYANFPPTDADSITAAAPPTISAATKSQDSTLTGWTTSCAAGDILRFNVDSCATITRLQLQLTITFTVS